MKISASFVHIPVKTSADLHSIDLANIEVLLMCDTSITMRMKDRLHIVADCTFIHSPGDTMTIHFKLAEGETAFAQVLTWLTARCRDTTIDWFGIKLRKEENNVTVSASQ